LFIALRPVGSVTSAKNIAAEAWSTATGRDAAHEPAATRCPAGATPWAPHLSLYTVLSGGEVACAPVVACVLPQPACVVKSVQHARCAWACRRDQRRD
jgi:hypothetical protein